MLAAFFNLLFLYVYVFLNFLSIFLPYFLFYDRFISFFEYMNCFTVLSIESLNLYFVSGGDAHKSPSAALYTTHRVMHRLIVSRAKSQVKSL